MRALEKQSFDVMLIDVFMPDMRGFESIRELSRTRARSPDRCNVRLYLRQHRARARLSADDAGTRRGTLPAKALRAKRPVDDRE